MNDVKKSEISGPAFSRKWDGFEKKSPENDNFLTPTPNDISFFYSFGHI